MQTIDIPISTLIETLKQTNHIPKDADVVMDGFHSPNIKFSNTNGVENILVIRTRD
jgi:hypothetical protein